VAVSISEKKVEINALKIKSPTANASSKTTNFAILFGPFIQQTMAEVIGKRQQKMRIGTKIVAGGVID
jgi:hypothetical protein